MRKDDLSSCDTYYVNGKKYEVWVCAGSLKIFDKILIYHLLRQTLHNGTFASNLVITTCDAISSDIFYKKGLSGHVRGNKIELSLKKIATISIIKHGAPDIECFSIFDSLIFDRETKSVHIAFSAHYLREVLETQFFDPIDFYEYRKLKSTQGSRLYEVLMQKFITGENWSICIKELAPKIGLVRQKYPSQILAKIRRALHSIHRDTNTRIEFFYNSQNKTCLFTKMSS